MSSSSERKKPLQFGPNGCQANVNGEKCGEKRTLGIIDDFKSLYEKKLKEIESYGSGDGNLKAKINLQEQWIKDLQEQNEMMVTAIEELEKEATDRVKMLEDKLDNSSKCICEVMKRYQDYNYTLNLDETFQKTFYMKNDITNLLEFVRRIREDHCWNIDGLTFYEISYTDLFGCKDTKFDCVKSSDPCGALCDSGMQSLNIGESEEINNEKLEDTMKSKDKDLDTLKKCMLDMRKALTEEVANKHDIICALKRDITKLEEQCIQVDKQTAFKDDIIKELRKEIKQLKLGEYETEISDLQARNATSFIENSCLKNQLTEIRNEIKNSTALSSINLSEVLNNLENVDFSADFSCIRNTANKEHLLIAVMEQEINALKEVAEIKDAQLEDQVKIITELVTQLYNIDKGLNILEKKFISLFDNTSGKTISKYIEDSVSYELLNNQQNKNNTGSSNFNNVEFDKSDSLSSELASAKSSEKERALENTKLKSKIEDAKALSKKLAKDYENSFEEKNDLKKKLKAEKEEKEKQADEAKTLGTTCGVKLKEISNLKDEIDKLKKELDKAKQENKDLKKKIDDLEEDQNKLKKKLRDANDDKERSNKELEKTKKDNRDLKKKLDDLEDDVSKLKKKLKDAKDDKEKLESLNDDLKKSNSKKDKEISKLKGDNEDSEKENKKLADENKKLKNDNDKLKKELDEEKKDEPKKVEPKKGEPVAIMAGVAVRGLKDGPVSAVVCQSVQVQTKPHEHKCKTDLCNCENINSDSESDSKSDSDLDSDSDKKKKPAIECSPCKKGNEGDNKLVPSLKTKPKDDKNSKVSFKQEPDTNCCAKKPTSKEKTSRETSDDDKPRRSKCKNRSTKPKRNNDEPCHCSGPNKSKRNNDDDDGKPYRCPKKRSEKPKRNDDDDDDEPCPRKRPNRSKGNDDEPRRCRKGSNKPKDSDDENCNCCCSPKESDTDSDDEHCSCCCSPRRSSKPQHSDDGDCSCCSPRKPKHRDNENCNCCCSAKGSNKPKHSGDEDCICCCSPRISNKSQHSIDKNCNCCCSQRGSNKPKHSDDENCRCYCSQREANKPKHHDDENCSCCSPRRSNRPKHSDCSCCCSQKKAIKPKPSNDANCNCWCSPKRSNKPKHNDDENCRCCCSQRKANTPKDSDNENCICCCSQREADKFKHSDDENCRCCCAQREANKPKHNVCCCHCQKEPHKQEPEHNIDKPCSCVKAPVQQQPQQNVCPLCCCPMESNKQPVNNVCCQCQHEPQKQEPEHNTDKYSCVKAPVQQQPQQDVYPLCCCPKESNKQPANIDCICQCDIGSDCKDPKQDKPKLISCLKSCKTYANRNRTQKVRIQGTQFDDVCPCECEASCSPSCLIKNLQKCPSNTTQTEDMTPVAIQCSPRPNTACEHLNEISGLQTALSDCRGRADNLQNAVDLYINSINVLEAAEEKSKIEIEQQRITIANLQGALVSVKQELEEFKDKNKQEINQHLGMVDVIYVNILQLEEANSLLENQVKKITTEYKNLRNLNFDLEVEHFNSLQDLSMLETQTSKYQHICNKLENTIACLQSQINTLNNEKSCYEELLRYFKHEMGEMSEQLCALQEILKMSCVTSQTENHQLVSAVEKLQCMNQCLSSEISSIDHKYSLECQMHKLKESKLFDMEKKLQSKCLELSHANDSCKQLSTQLERVLHRNQQFENIICKCNCQLRKLQKTLQEYECENDKQMCDRSKCQCEILQCQKHLQELNKMLQKKDCDLECLQKEYREHLKELEKVKEELCNKHNIVNQLKKCLCESKEDNAVLYEECKDLKQQINCLTREDPKTKRQLKVYQKIIIDIKNMLTERDSPIFNHLPDLKQSPFEIEIPEDKYLQMADEIKEIIFHLIQIFCKSKEENKKAQDEINMLHQKIVSLSRKELSKENELKIFHRILNELKDILSRSDEADCDHQVTQKTKTQDNTTEDVQKQMVGEIKQMVCDFKKQLKEKNCMIKQLEKQVNLNEESLKNSKKCKKDNETICQKLAHSQGEEKRLSQTVKKLEYEVSTLRGELKEKDKQINCFCENLQKMKSGKNVELTCIQDECNVLKNEINRLTQRQIYLTEENEKLATNVIRFQKRATELEEKNIIMKDQLEQYLLELESIHHEKEVIEHKYHKLTCDFQSLQNNFSCLERQNRYSTNSLHTLEQELRDIKIQKDDITNESSHVIENMKLWLQEQRNINQHVSKKIKEYCEIIEKLKTENEILKQSASNHQTSRPNRSQSRDRNIKCKQQNLPETSAWDYRCDSPDFTVENERSRRCHTPTWSLGSQGTGSYFYAANEFSPQNPCDQCPSFQDWYSPNFRDNEETDEEDVCSEQFIEKVQSMVAQFQKANKLWKTKMNNCEYCVSKDEFS